MPQSYAPPSFHPTRVASRRELAFVIALTGLFHAGGALAALTVRDEVPKHRSPSRVEIQIARPEPRRPPLVPTPPPIARPLPKPAASALARSERLEQRVESQPETAKEQPPDTGSALPSSPDGTLIAGSGGLGIAPPPSAPPAPPARPEQPAQVIPAREGANYLKNPRPEYPGLARRQGWEGSTLLRVQVGPSGHALSVQVQRSSGRDTLDDAAKRAVAKWSFVPATQGNNPVTGWVTVPIVFRLQ
jgi:periplasmic protein TonB